MGIDRLTLHEYETLMEQTPIFVWRADTEALCDYFNERWLAFRGRTVEQELGNGWTEGLHPDDYERCFKIYLEGFGKKEIFEMEYRLERRDGVYRWLLVRGVPYFNENRNFAGYIGSCIDVTDLVEAQESLNFIARLSQIPGSIF